MARRRGTGVRDECRWGGRIWGNDAEQRVRGSRENVAIFEEGDKDSKADEHKERDENMWSGADDWCSGSVRE